MAQTKNVKGKGAAAKKAAGPVVDDARTVQAGRVKPPNMGTRRPVQAERTVFEEISDLRDEMELLTLRKHVAELRRASAKPADDIRVEGGRIGWVGGRVGRGSAEADALLKDWGGLKEREKEIENLLALEQSHPEQAEIHGVAVPKFSPADQAKETPAGTLSEKDFRIPLNVHPSPGVKADSLPGAKVVANAITDFTGQLDMPHQPLFRFSGAGSEKMRAVGCKLPDGAISGRRLADKSVTETLEPQRQAEIPAQMETLRDLLDVALNQIDELTVKLSPVLAPIPPENSSGHVSKELRTDLGAFIGLVVDKARKVNDEIYSLKYRLEV